MKTIKRYTNYKWVDGVWKGTTCQSLTFEPFEYSHENIELVSEKIRSVLKPKYLKPYYREENKTNPLYGHCYHSTQALFYLMDKELLVPTKGIDDRGFAHWFLKEKITGKVFDPTQDQYLSVSRIPPHKDSKPAMWFMSQPGENCLEIIEQIMTPNITNITEDLS